MADLKKEIYNLQEQVREAIISAGSEQDLSSIKNTYLGRKGKVTAILRRLPELTEKERPVVGQLANKVKKELDADLADALSKIKKSTKQAAGLDVTLPGRFMGVGRSHPIIQMEKTICDIFSGMGFEIARGPEVEQEYYNFEALNFLEDHPARDMQDTLYIHQGEILMRTHTSPMQIRVMEGREPPLRVICPGKTFRADTPDASHSPMFHQVEGFMVDENISLADLKGVLTLFARQLFGSDTPVRFRPSFFPFTEPSAEVDIGCLICGAKGCRVCKGTGWLEILGAGMIDPAVFGFVDFDPEKYTGFAFGVGVERVTMLVYGIDDIRMFFENDLRFLSQF
jgi:phenylalanyl-tRNA synthetase alpha chain